MATRVQALKLGLGKAKQADIVTVAGSFLTFEKTNEDVTSVNFTTENDAPWIGKGNEFVSSAGVYPVSQTPQNRIEMYGSAEMVTWAFAYALGHVAEATGLYTLKPIQNGTTLELPYFSICEQMPEGGAEAIDNVYVGCSMEDVTFTLNSGPGLQSTKVVSNWVGSGNYTSPSTVSLPSLTTQHFMPGASAALTVNGTDYVAAKTLLNATIGWKNNLLLNAGFFPGSGTQNGAAVRGRMEIGVRQPTFEFTVRLLSTSTEFASLVGLTSGTAVLTVTFDATHTTTFTFGEVTFESVTNTVVDGIAAVRVVCAVQDSDGTGNPLIVTSKCGITGIAQ
ncbi:MAG TPA: hypothetical protein VGN17_00435 [Bryobacteraceae bacterium]|jgi:hypothetical protein